MLYRYVGELSLVGLKDGRLFCRFSVLDFWGNREVRSSELLEPVSDHAYLTICTDTFVG